MANCWFCSTPGSKSAEHIFPRWLNDVIPGQVGPDVEVNETQLLDNERTERSWIRTGPARETLTSVCGSCNSGWMSNLEDRSKPLLSPLIRDEATELDVADLVVVSTWATKTAYMVESRNVQSQVVSSPEARAIVREEDRPPASIQVDLFRFCGAPLSGYRRHVAVVGRRGEPLGEAANYAVTVMTFGHLGVRVVDDRADWREPILGAKAPGVSGLVTAYPSVTALRWPIDGERFDEEGVKRIRLSSMPDDVNVLGEE